MANECRTIISKETLETKIKKEKNMFKYKRLFNYTKEREESE